MGRIKLNWKKLSKRPSILLLSMRRILPYFRAYVEYYDAIDSKKLALDFANYGLSITPKIASVPKNFFKTYIRSGEIVKTND